MSKEYMELDLGDMGFHEALVHYEYQAPEPRTGIHEAITIKKVMLSLGPQILDVKPHLTETTIELLEFKLLEEYQNDAKKWARDPRY